MSEQFGPAVRIIGSATNPHPADGLTAQVALGDGAYSTILNPRSFEDGGLVWRLTWSDPEHVRCVAASAIESYDYLISGAITMKEAIRRLRMLRAARRHLCDRDATLAETNEDLAPAEGSQPGPKASPNTDGLP